MSFGRHHRFLRGDPSLLLRGRATVLRVRELTEGQPVRLRDSRVEVGDCLPRLAQRPIAQPAIVEGLGGLARGEMPLQGFGERFDGGFEAALAIGIDADG